MSGPTSFKHEIYSQRQAFPFSACVQVIETPFARALSVDSVNWQIQTICESHQQQWKIINDPSLQRRYILYGHWSQPNGLSRLPIDPYLDIPAHDQLDILIAALVLNADKAPYLSRDHYELWLLDKLNHLPLILIATRTSEHKINLEPTDNWTLSRQFASPSNELSQIIQHHLTTELGIPACFQWFRRDSVTGNGHAIESKQAIYHNQLDNLHFPELILREQWPESSITHQFITFQNYFSPQLLTLPSISDTRRQQLEIAAQSQPLLVSHYYRSYPKILDQKLFNKILVEAKFRNNL